MRSSTPAIALALALALGACADGGGADDADDADDMADAESSAGQGTEPLETTSPADGSLSEADKAAIEETIVAFLLEPRCDLAVDDYLSDLAVVDDATPEEGCEFWESGFVEPQFSAEDILITDLQGKDGVATLEVGSEDIDLTTRYELTLVDGTWLLSGDQYNSDL